MREYPSVRPQRRQGEWSDKMCLAISGRITGIQDGEAAIDFGGISKTADTRLVEDVKIGDSVLVHAGFIISRIDEKSANELEKLVAETMRSLGK